MKRTDLSKLPYFVKILNQARPKNQELTRYETLLHSTSEDSKYLWRISDLEIK